MKILLVSLISSLLYVVSFEVNADTLLSFTPAEKQIIASLSISALPSRTDTSNRYSQDPKAAALGKTLFFERRLSNDHQVSCASCHRPEHNWSSTDTLPGLRPQNPITTPSLWNVAQQRWFFHDGRADTLWAQALEALESKLDIAGDRTAITRLLLSDTALQQQYTQAFGAFPSVLNSDLLPAVAQSSLSPSTTAISEQPLAPAIQEGVNQVFVNVGKAIAAFETTLISPPTAFDQFAAQLSHPTEQTSTHYPMAAQQGLKLFIGKANCVRCHMGANFTDSEFHQTLWPTDNTDQGRVASIALLKNNPFNSIGIYADKNAQTRNRIAYLYESPVFRQAYKTPSLRAISLTAPYLHTGRVTSLAEIVHGYNLAQVNNAQASYGEHFKPLGLSSIEEGYLVTFLTTLTPSSLDTNHENN